MKLVYLLVLGLLAAQAPCTAQSNTGKISGRVVDEKAIALPFANVALMHASDSTLVTGVAADVDGKFSIETINNGSYIVSVTMVGYKKTVSSAVQIENNSVHIPDLTLLNDSKNLEELTITAKKPFVEQLIDKTVINVANSIVSAGSSVLQVLEKSPGITINTNQEQIELAGKSSPMVYIDGKPSYLSQSDLFTLLKNTPSDNIEKIELITNPSSRYDAAGNSGIINIVFKKGNKPGTNGSLMVSSGVVTHGYGRGSAAASMNHNAGRVNFFGSFNAMEGKGFSKTIYDRTITTDAAKIRFDQVYGNTHWLKSYGYRAGADFNLHKNTILGVNLFGSLSGIRTLFRYSDTKLFDTDENLKQKYYTTASTRDHRNNFNANLNFRHSSSGGAELAFSADYLRYGGRKVNALATLFYHPDNTSDGNAETVRNTMPLSISIGVAKIDLTRKFRKFVLESGIKSSIVKADNEMIYETYTTQWITDIFKSNRFKYNENINAAYASLNGTIGKNLTAQLGLRLEHTNLTGRSTTLNKSQSQNYIRLFPTAFLSRQFDPLNTLTVSYSYRIDRPNYQLLNPFESYLDPYTTLRGNPNLRPQFTHNFQLAHLFKNTLSTTVAYSFVNDLIVNELPSVVEDESKMYLSPGNLSTQRNLNLTLAAPLDITEWWNMQTNISGRLNRYRSYYKAERYEVSQLSYTVGLNNAFSITPNWSAELSGNYYSSRIYGLIICRPSGAINLGIQKSILQKRASVKITGQDIFFTNRFIGSSHFSDLDFNVTSLGVSQTFLIAFTYKLGTSSLMKEKSSTNGADDLRTRASGN